MLNSDRRTSIFARVLAWVIIFILASVCTIIVVAAPQAIEDAQVDASMPIAIETTIDEQTEPVIVLNDIPTVFPEFEYRLFYDSQLCEEYLEELSMCLQILSSNVESNEYTDEAVTIMQAEVARIQAIYTAVEADEL
jgi:hypothetical protein